MRTLRNILPVITVVFIYPAVNAAAWRLRSPLTYYGAAFGNGGFAVVGQNGSILTSRYAKTWAPAHQGIISILFPYLSGRASHVYLSGKCHNTGTGTWKGGAKRQDVREESVRIVW